MTTALVLITIILINIVFGYWRSNTRKFSLQWVSAIHVPVIISIALRLALLGWNWWLIPIFVADFTIGQYTGGYIRKILNKKYDYLGSFLLKDIYILLITKPDRTEPSPPGG